MRRLIGPLVVVTLGISTLTGCAPSLPSPPPTGAATLSDDVIPYDDIDFPTNRKPIATPDQVCDIFNSRMVSALGYPSYPERDKYTNADNGTCRQTLGSYDASSAPGAKLTIAPTAFSAYWRNSPPTDYQNPGYLSSYSSSFRRLIFNKSYYAVESTQEGTSDFTCTLVLNTGSPYVLMFQMNKNKATIADKPEICGLARRAASFTVSTYDTNGGSIAN